MPVTVSTLISLVSLLAALSVLDTVTVIPFMLLDPSLEANPVGRWLWINYGAVGLVAAKGLMVLAAALMIIPVKKQGAEPLYVVALMAMCGITAVAALTNVYASWVLVGVPLTLVLMLLLGAILVILFTYGCVVAREYLSREKP